MTAAAGPGTYRQNNRISLIQVQYIFQEFGKRAQTLATEPADWLENPEQGPIEFIYQRDHVLTRPEDVAHINGALEKLTKLGQKVAVVGHPIRVEGFDLVLLQLTPVPDLPDVLEKIEELTDKPVMVSPNHLVSISPATYCPATEPMVPEHPQQEPSIGPAAGFDGKNVNVAVVDTGFVAGAPAHPWMAGITGDPEPPRIGPFLDHYSAHGLFAASTIRAIAPRARVHVWRVFADGGNTRFETDLVSDLRNKVLVQEPVPDIISLSAGTHTWKRRTSLAFRAFLDQVMLPHHPRTILVAAAGNDGQDWKFAPADLAVTHPHRVVSVGALSRDSKRVANFSDRGSWVSVYAWGRDLVQAYAKGTYRYREAQNKPDAQFNGMARWSGTSFATPLVSGLIAARMSGRHLSALDAWKELRQIAENHALNANGIHAPRLRPHDANA
jgi:subtilisin family serine protease